MVRPLRDKDRESFRLITIRTEESRLWISPNHDTRRTLGGIVARYQEIFKIELYAFTFLSNHPHLLIKAPEGNADEFCENVNREVARRINFRNRRIGKFWARRYDDQKILSKDDLLTAFLYVTNNGVKHGLVEHPSLWPGLSSYKQSINEKEVRYSFHHYSAKRELDRVSTHTLKLTPLPQFAHLKRAERMKLIAKLIDDNATEHIKRRREAGRGFLGMDAIRVQIPGERPKETARKARPTGYSKHVELIRKHKEEERLRRDRYNECSRRFRLGDLQVTFPTNTHKPPMHRKPRLRPFVPLPDDYFKNPA